MSGSDNIKNRVYKLNTIIFLLFISFSLSQTVIAHPPSKLSLKYNDEINELIVNITHNVATQDHYIKTIEIYINDVKYNILNYDSQPSRTSFSYNYNIIAEKGDNIKVIAKCNRAGSLTEELTIGEGNNESSTPGFILILSIISIFLIIIFYKKNKFKNL